MVALVPISRWRRRVVQGSGAGGGSGSLAGVRALRALLCGTTVVCLFAVATVGDAGPAASVCVGLAAAARGPRGGATPIDAPLTSRPSNAVMTSPAGWAGSKARLRGGHPG